MDDTWVITANAGRARFFSQANPADQPAEINDMVNTAARLRTVDTETDDLGLRSASKSRHSTGAATPQSGYEPHQTPAEHQTEIFARDVAGYLAKAHQEGRFRHLVLVASPEFLGVLRKLLPAQVATAVRLEIAKDYTQLRSDELRSRIDTEKAKS